MTNQQQCEQFVQSVQMFDTGQDEQWKKSVFPITISL
jgi:hypothetical protein